MAFVQEWQRLVAAKSSKEGGQKVVNAYLLNVDYFLKIPPIRQRATFKKVFSVGQKIISKYFNLYYDGHSNICLGIQISKQDVPTAVKRNYLRRIVREHVRMARHKLPKARLIFLGKREAGRAAKEDLHQCLEKLIVTLIEQSK